MKAVKVLALVAMMLSAHAAHAACLGQETTIVFINGVWTTDTEAKKHAIKLSEVSYASGISESCVHFDYSHTQDDTKSRDIAEALIQKSNELNVPLLTLVRAFLWANIPNPVVRAAIDDVLVSGYQDTVTIIDTQLEKHLKKFKDISLNLGQRGIMATHSQGGLYGNAMWNDLNLTERSNTRLVTVSNPSSGAVDGGPNTRLSRDGVANRFFLAASLEGLIRNTDRPCDTEAETSENSWSCHGFETGYLHDVPARAQIVSDIKEALPVAAILGTVRDFTGGSSFVSGAVVSLFSNTILVAETLADTQGLYRFDNVPAPCPECFVKAKSAIIDVCGTTATPVIAGEVRVADITLDGSCDAPPTGPSTDFSGMHFGTGTLIGNSFAADVPAGTNLVFVGLAYVNADGFFPKPDAPWFRFGGDDACDFGGTITDGVYSHVLSSNMSGLCPGRDPTVFYDVLGFQIGDVRHVTVVYKFHNAGTISAPVWEFVAP